MPCLARNKGSRSLYDLSIYLSLSLDQRPTPILTLQSSGTVPYRTVPYREGYTVPSLDGSWGARVCF